jgi:hypothetical protein
MRDYETTITSDRNVAGFLTSTGNRKMTHSIENSQNTLTRLLEKVRDDAARKSDYIAPTHDLQKTTNDQGEPQIVIEQRGGEPTRVLNVNDVAFGQIASHAGIDVRTARRLQAGYSDQFDGLLNAIWQKEPSVRMLRAHDGLALSDGGIGTLRAFVSDKFKTYDHVNLLNDADNAALGLKIRDRVGVYSSRESFDAILDGMKAAAADVIDGVAIDKTDVVANLGAVMKLTKAETSDVMNGLLDTIGQSGYERDKPLSRATLINAVTAVSHKADTDDVDLWQQRGGQLLNMKPADWQRVAAIAA